jgi:hypothetical protein
MINGQLSGVSGQDLPVLAHRKKAEATMFKDFLRSANPQLTIDNDQS